MICRPDSWTRSPRWSTRVTSHREFLLRPDLGRRLSDESLATVRARCARGVDVQLIVADGLSAVACAQNVPAPAAPVDNPLGLPDLSKIAPAATTRSGCWTNRLIRLGRTASSGACIGSA